MKVFPSEKIREIDAYTIRHEPIASIDLMERAATVIYNWIEKNISRKRPVYVFAGPGNNGGDALAVSRMMAEAGYALHVFLVTFSPKLSPDCTMNLERLEKWTTVQVNRLDKATKFPGIPREAVIIDGLFGSGLNRPPKGLAAEIIQKINRSGVRVVAIDMPSGLFGEDNRNNPGDAIVCAGDTLALQFPRFAFFFPENEQFVGNWHILPIGLHPEAISETPTTWYYTLGVDVAPRIRVRRRFSHKGTFGHALLMAGCYGRMGAAVLAARSCLRTGVGLLTVHVPKYGNDILQTALPEAMISLDQSDILVSNIPDLQPYSAVGIGPAMGCRQNSQKALLALLEQSRVPLVLDADAINILAAQPEWLRKLPPGTILTPHPGEFDRLAGDSESGLERLEKAIRLAGEFKVIMVLKGAHTAVVDPQGNVCFNSSGNPGMATAGSGDVLTGIILALLTQGYDPRDAAITGVYLHGLAGDLAVAESSPEALMASDITSHLGKAFKQLYKLRADDLEE